LAGTVDEVNPVLANQPELINTDPYGEGWMIKMTVSDAGQYENLLTSEAYQKLIS